MTFLFSFLFPLLVVMLLLQTICQWLGKSINGWRPTFILGVIAILAAIVPVGGIPLARWPISLNANFCIPFTVVVFNKVWQMASISGRVLLDKKALLSFWIYGVITGLVLYPMALGLGPFDPYVLGWHFSWLFGIFMVLTIVLLWRKNRLGIVLMLSILGYNFQLLESPNLWDYFIDPIYLIISIIALVVQFFRYSQNSPGISANRGNN
jgi:hypothetical protein